MDAQIVVEERGSHFTAWARGDAGQPLNGVLMVGQNAAEAEARLRTWLAGRPGAPPAGRAANGGNAPAAEERR